MEKKLTVAVIGCGEFARNFVPLFKAHPLVEKVYVCDVIPARAQEYSEKFDVEIVDSFESALKNPAINAVAIFTQRHTARWWSKRCAMASTSIPPYRWPARSSIATRLWSWSKKPV